MPVSARIELKGDKVWAAALRRMNPEKNPKFVTRALLKAAFLVQELAATEKILRSGTPGVVHPTQITSRSGTLRRSIAVDSAGTPHFVVIGSNVVYAGVHEFGSRDGKTRKRPYIKPAMVDVEKKMAAIFAREWEREVRKR